MLHFSRESGTVRFYNPEGQREFEMLNLSVHPRTAHFVADQIDFRMTLKSNNRAVLDGEAGEMMLHGPFIKVRHVPTISQAGCSWPKRTARDPWAARVE
jgi:hypothetical protein